MTGKHFGSTSVAFKCAIQTDVTLDIGCELLIKKRYLVSNETLQDSPPLVEPSQ